MSTLNIRWAASGRAAYWTAAQILGTTRCFSEFVSTTLLLHPNQTLKHFQFCAKIPQEIRLSTGVTGWASAIERQRHGVCCTSRGGKRAGKVKTLVVRRVIEPVVNGERFFSAPSNSMKAYCFVDSNSDMKICARRPTERRANNEIAFTCAGAQNHRIYSLYCEAPNHALRRLIA